MFPTPLPERRPEPLPSEELIPTEKPERSYAARHSWFDRAVATIILVLMFLAFAVMMGMLMAP